jgi:hypothetical protein
MARELALSVTISRALLGLTPLEINDQVLYKVAPGLLGGQVSWQRTTASSPYMDDDITVNRRRGRVNEPLLVEVFGRSKGQPDATSPKLLKDNLTTLIQAMVQDTFDLTIVMDAQTYTYACEAADYSMAWTTPRWAARQLQVAFVVPRAPVPVSGPI